VYSRNKYFQLHGASIALTGVLPSGIAGANCVSEIFKLGNLTFLRRKNSNRRIAVLLWTGAIRAYVTTQPQYFAQPLRWHPISTIRAVRLPAYRRVLGWVAQLAKGHPKTLAELDVELDGSNSIFV
jgi:hypothetical protein